MNAQAGHSSLLTIWNQQRHHVMSLGQSLHHSIPIGEPEVTIHGRDLQPETEGVGFQFQLTINGNLYDGRFQAAYYVVQVQLVKLRAGLGWLVDAMPILEVEHSNYDLYTKRTREFVYRDRQALDDHFLQDLAHDATLFFDYVRRAEPPPEEATPFGGERTAPVL